MPYSINDYIKRFTGGSDITSGLSSWFSRTHAESIQDAEKRYLLAQGGTSDGTIQDLWKEILTKSGYTGGVGDQLYSYWKAPVVFKLGTSSSPIFGSTGTFTRATTKTYTDGDGDLQSAAISELIHTNIGFVLEPQRTNKCTNYNANPDVGLTNLTKGGDAASTLTRVSDSTELAAAGLDNICIDGNVIKLDNSAGVAVANVQPTGVTGGTNVHTASTYWRGSGNGRVQLNGTAGTGIVALPSSYTKIETVITPSASQAMLIVAEAGAVVYFILNQMEEGANVTSSIITEGSATTRNADQLSYPTTNIPANDCVLSFDWTPAASSQGTVFLLGSLLDASNHVTVYWVGTAITFRKMIGGVPYTAATTHAYSADTLVNFKLRLSSAGGIDMWINDSKATGDSNTTDAVFGTSINIGADASQDRHQTGGINNFTVYSGSFTDEEVVNL